MASLSDLQTLRTVLGRLNAEKPSGTGEYSDQTKHQEREGDLQRRLMLEVESRQGKARALVTGQIGVGKSSELWHFFRRRIPEKSRRFLVFCDLEKGEHPEKCGATGVFLTIFRDTWYSSKLLISNLNRKSEKTICNYNELQDEILLRLTEWLKGERIEEKELIIFKFGGMDFPVFYTNKFTAVSLILSKAAQHEAVSHREDRFGLAPDSLINLLNKYLEWIIEYQHGIKPVIIVDHVDKIRDPDAAREVLTEVVPHWQRIQASVIMTAPYEYTLGEMRNTVESYWGKPFMVYPLEIPELDSGTIPDIYHKIVKSCGLAKLIDPESLKILAHYSGGITRTFVQFLIDASKEAYMAGHRCIEYGDAQSVVFVAELAYQDYGYNELKQLDEINQRKVGLRSAAVILRSPIGLLVNRPTEGEQLLRVHPLAERLLERYRFNKELVSH